MSERLLIPHVNDRMLDPSGNVTAIWRAFLEQLARVATMESTSGEDTAQLVESVNAKAQLLVGTLSGQARLIEDLQQLLHHQNASNQALLGRLNNLERQLGDLSQLVAASTSVI